MGKICSPPDCGAPTTCMLYPFGELFYIHHVHCIEYYIMICLFDSDAPFYVSDGLLGIAIVGGAAAVGLGALVGIGLAVGAKLSK